MRIQTIIEREDLRPRVHAKIMRKVNEKVGQRHVRQRVGKHFSRNSETSPGSGAYRYARRSKQTKEIKRRTGADPERPNYRTGRMKAFVQSSSIVRRTQHRWTWTAKSLFPLKLTRRQEIEAISRREIDADVKLMERLYVREARKPSNRRKRRRKVG